jgi:hypothetical protein
VDPPAPPGPGGNEKSAVDETLKKKNKQLKKVGKEGRTEGRKEGEEIRKEEKNNKQLKKVAMSHISYTDVDV